MIFLAPADGFLKSDIICSRTYSFTYSVLFYYLIIVNIFFMEAVFTGNPVYYVGKIRSLFFPKLRVHIKDNNISPRGKFHRFLFRDPFSNKFPDLNFAPYVLYINRK